MFFQNSSNPNIISEFDNAPLPEGFQPLPSTLMEDIGLTPIQPKQIENQIIPPAFALAFERRRAKSHIHVEFPKNRTKSHSLTPNSYIVSTCFGFLKVYGTPTNTIRPGSNVIIQDGPILRYGTIIPNTSIPPPTSIASFSDKHHSYILSENPNIVYIDESGILVSNLIDRDRKARIILNLIMEKNNANFEIVFLETVSWSHRAAFHLGHKTHETAILNQIVNGLTFIYSCPVFTFYVE